MSFPAAAGSVISSCVLIVILVSMSAVTGIAQQRDSSLFFRANVSVTQNGFSFIPSFSLGKPALIFEPSIGNKRLSFEPQFRFALEGKPWSFIFIYRYKIITRTKFQLEAGGHVPSIVFVTQSVTRNGAPEDVIVAHRFAAAELIPDYIVSQNLRVGIYLLRGHGFDNSAVQETSFVGVRSQFTNIRLSPRLTFRITPQLFYLKTDDKDGVFATGTMTLALNRFPLSVSSIINKAIESEIPAKDFDWNVSLVYSFDKRYDVRKN